MCMLKWVAVDSLLNYVAVNLYGKEENFCESLIVVQWYVYPLQWVTSFISFK